MFRKSDQLLSIMVTALALVLFGSAASGQEICQAQDGSRDSVYLKYERHSKTEVVFRLYNNSTCSIVVDSDSIELPKELSDGEMVPGLIRFTKLKFGHEGVTVWRTGGGDVVYSHALKGGRSLVFAVPRKSLKAREIICVPFEFDWELKPLRFSQSMKFSGNTFHFAFVSYSELPRSVL